LSLPWNALHAGLRADIARHRFLRGFNALARGWADLAPFPEPQALLDHQHRVSTDAMPDRDSVVRALVGAAQAGDDSASHAQTLLLLALWPGLDAVRGRLRRFRPAEDIAPDIIGAFIDEVGRINLDRVNRVAATLLRNLERDLKRAWRAEALHLIDSFDEEWDLDETNPNDPVSSLPSREAIIDDQRRWLRVRQIIGGDADLVRRVVLEGYSQADAGRFQGLGPDTARKRFQRAMTRLAASQGHLRGGCPVSPP
jgi:DNA-directed RNA polymerase specialized sigma24 family protein